MGAAAVILRNKWFLLALVIAGWGGVEVGGKGVVNWVLSPSLPSATRFVGPPVDKKLGAPLKIGAEVAIAEPDKGAGRSTLSGGKQPMLDPSEHLDRQAAFEIAGRLRKVAGDDEVVDFNLTLDIPKAVRQAVAGTGLLGAVTRVLRRRPPSPTLISAESIATE